MLVLQDIIMLVKQLWVFITISLSIYSLSKLECVHEHIHTVKFRTTITVSYIVTMGYVSDACMHACMVCVCVCIIVVGNVI